MTQAQEKNLIEFALLTLNILEENEEWDADVPDDIGAVAYTLGLAASGNDGMFAVNRDIYHGDTNSTNN